MSTGITNIAANIKNKQEVDCIKKNRFSNIELLRIIAMFLVLVVHANFFSLGQPTSQEISEVTLPSFMRFFFQSSSILCVDVFVLISGWFSLKPTFIKTLNFLFQCLFFLIGIYIACLALNISLLSIKGVASCFFLLRWNWFIKAYLGLMILAPVINTFIENSSEKKLRNVLLCFYVFQTLYGWLSGVAVFFLEGYSTMSFIGLYMLARYVRLYPNRFTTNSKSFDLMVFISIILIQSIIPFFLLWSSGMIFSYISPLVILSALYLLLLFSKIHIKSNFINLVAISSFAVFLLHTNPNICEQCYVPTIRKIYNCYYGVECLFMIFIFLVGVFVIAILVDKVRIIIWNLIRVNLLTNYQ